MKLKTCAICRIKFAPSRQMQVVCSPLCAAEYGRKQHAKAEARKADKEIAGLMVIKVRERDKRTDWNTCK